MEDLRKIPNFDDDESSGFKLVGEGVGRGVVGVAGCSRRRGCCCCSETSLPSGLSAVVLLIRKGDPISAASINHCPSKWRIELHLGRLMWWILGSSRDAAKNMSTMAAKPFMDLKYGFHKNIMSEGALHWNQKSFFFFLNPFRIIYLKNISGRCDRHGWWVGSMTSSETMAYCKTF